MAQKQHKGLRNAGTFREFLNPASGNNRDRQSSQPGLSPDSPATIQSSSANANSDNASCLPAITPPEGVEHGEEALALALTHGETPGPAKTNSPSSPSSRSPPAPEAATMGPGQKEVSSPGDGTGAGSDRPDPSHTVVGRGYVTAGSESAPVVVIVGGDAKEEERPELSVDAGEDDGERERAAVTTVAMPPAKPSSDGTARDKDVKRSTSLKQSIFRRSGRQAKEDRRSSECNSRDPPSSESEVDSGNNLSPVRSSGPPSASQPSPIHISRSCPSELPLLEEQQQQQHLGFETSGSSVGSPSEKLSPSGRSDKDDKSPRSVMRNSGKKSPWYTVLSASYKSKSEEFRKYFKNIHNSEKLMADYSCALQKDILVQGRMYVTENWLCFYANIFKWETLLTIRLKDITAITKERTIRLIPNAVQIATESEKYFFTSFMSRDRTFLLLFKVWQNALLDQKMPAAEYWTRVHSNYGTNLGLSPEELPEDYVWPRLEMENEEENEFDECKSQGTEGMEIEEDEDDDDDDEDNDVEEDEEEVEEEEDEVDEEEDEVDEEYDSVELSGQEELPGSGLAGQEVGGQEVELDGAAASASDPLASKTLDEEGEVESLEPKPLHPNAKEYMNSYFNVTVDTFYAAMYNKEHPFYQNFLLHRKHTDLNIGEWKQEEEKEVRRVSYTLHLNNPVGPKSCGVEERQVFFKNWSRPGHSYVVNLEVWQTGVPYADYFYTEARMVITRVSSTSCHVRVTAHLVYKKSPWGPIKGFIERNSDSGIRGKHVELDTYVRQHLESRAPVKSVAKKTRKRKVGGGVRKEVKESPRPLRRMESVSVAKAKSTSIARYLPPWLRTDSRNVMLLICIFLTLLSIVNVSLFLQLQTLEQLAVRTEQDWKTGVFADNLKDIPQSKDEWSALLQKQLYYHELEMERWREVLGLCIDLMKKTEVTLQELHTGIKPTRIPDLDAVLRSVHENTRQNEE